MPIDDFREDLCRKLQGSQAQGVPLHAFALGSGQFAAVGEALRSATGAERSGAAFAALYVLWASERIRLEYDGRGLSWDFINRPLGTVLEGARVDRLVQRGLSHWKRPVRRGRSGNSLYMYSLMAEGGIPMKVLETASHHATALRSIIEEIGNHGGLAILGHDGAKDIALARMRHLPDILKNDETISLFVELAERIYAMRSTLPRGISVGDIEAWLDRTDPEWQRSLPLRLTPQVIDNIIRPSLTAQHRQVKTARWPVMRELHQGDEGRFQSVAVLAAQAVLPLQTLPVTEGLMLRLLPRFETRRPFVYRATRTAGDQLWELERIGATGREVVALWPYQPLEFDVMRDQTRIGTWCALPGLPDPAELMTFWSGDIQTDEVRLLPMSSGRTRHPALWVILPEEDAPGLEGSVTLQASFPVTGGVLHRLTGQGWLSQHGQRVAIATGAEEADGGACIVTFGDCLPRWRLATGEPVHLGEPHLYGQLGDQQLVRIPPNQLRRRTLRSGTWAAELFEWVVNDQVVAAHREIWLPKEAALKMSEAEDGALRFTAKGLPQGLVLELTAGDLQQHQRIEGDVVHMQLPPRGPETAFVTLTVSDLINTKKLVLTAPWPSDRPQLLLRRKILAPGEPQIITFDELKDLTAIAPGNDTRLFVGLPAANRQFDIPLNGQVPLVRHTDFLRKLLHTGTADTTITLKLGNPMSETPRLTVARHHEAMSLTGDFLSLGQRLGGGQSTPVTSQQCQGQADLHALNIRTGEAVRLALSVGEDPVDLRTTTGLGNGLWLIQGMFCGRRQRPAAWRVAGDNSLEGDPAILPRRDQRIAAYAQHFETLAGKNPNAPELSALLDLLLAAREGGDPAVLDQFHGLADAPHALATLLFTLPSARLNDLFSLDSYWNGFWPGYPSGPLAEAAGKVMAALAEQLQAAGLDATTALGYGRSALVTRLADLRLLRTDMDGLIAALLLKLDLLGTIATDQRFDGILISRPAAAFADALQDIARADPNLPKGLKPIQPVRLSFPGHHFHFKVCMIAGAAMALAEASMGLRPNFDANARLDLQLIETAVPDLFHKALHPAFLLAVSEGIA